MDDESAVRDFLTVLLQSRGYGVRTASGAGEALDLFEREGPLIRLLLTDVLMPDVTGPVLVSRVLALRPTLPVLYMSGFPGEVPLAGPFPCLKKPFALAELIDHIDQSLAC